MVIKTYLDKTNTIVYNSDVNTGQNPVCELYYGDGFTRVLFHFDLTKLQNLINDKTYSDITKLKHVLKIKNCWGLQNVDERMVYNSGKSTIKERTSSFDLELLRLPEYWDGGVGNDFTVDGFLTKEPTLSYNASNWFNSQSETPWADGDGAITGVTSGNTVAIQHFSIGNEDIEIDLTDEITDILTGNTTNYGYMLKFPNLLEDTKTNITQYCGFFTQHTQTAFRPFVETTYSEVTSDDRNNFYLDKNNKLYFYSKIGGSLKNLDELPVCFINETQYDVKQCSKGVYYIELNLSSLTNESNIMLYDTWSNIKYNGNTFSDVELDFVTKTPVNYFNFGSGDSNCEIKRYIPNVYGIRYGERINLSEDIRKIYIQIREEYVVNKTINTDNVYYRLYVKESDKEIDFITFTQANKTTTENYFLLDMGSLLPNEYFLDIKVFHNDEWITHKEMLFFKVVSEL
jgi:hypothetical protein